MEESDEEDETSNFVALSCTTDMMHVCSGGEAVISGYGNSDNPELTVEEDSDGEEVTNEYITEKYGQLFSKWIELVNVNKDLNSEVASLKGEMEKLEAKCVDLYQEKDGLTKKVMELEKECEKSELRLLEMTDKAKNNRRELQILRTKGEADKKELATLRENLESEKKLLHSLNKSSKNLNQILILQQRAEKKSGIGFTGEEKTEQRKSMKAENSKVSERKQRKIVKAENSRASEGKQRTYIRQTRIAREKTGRNSKYATTVKTRTHQETLL